MYILSKVTAPQDAHKRLVLQVYLESNQNVVSRLLENKVYFYLAKTSRRF